MTETVQLIDTLFWNTRLFGYILNVLDIIRKMGFQYYFPHRTSHPGALHLTIKLPDEQSCPPPLAFFCKLRGTLPEFLKARDRRGTGAPPATMNQPTEPALTYSFIYIATKKPAPPAIHCQCSRPFKIRSKLHSKSTSKLKSTGQEPSLQLKCPSIQLIIHTLLRDQRLMISTLNNMPVI